MKNKLDSLSLSISLSIDIVCCFCGANNLIENSGIHISEFPKKIISKSTINQEDKMKESTLTKRFLSQPCFTALFCIVAINLFNVCASEKYSPSDFVNSIFNFSGLKEGLYEISITNSTTSMDGQTIMAYGHFNR